MMCLKGRSPTSFFWVSVLLARSEQTRGTLLRLPLWRSTVIQPQSQQSTRVKKCGTDRSPNIGGQDQVDTTCSEVKILLRTISQRVSTNEYMAEKLALSSRLAPLIAEGITQASTHNVVREGDLLAVTDLLQYSTVSPRGTSAALLISA